MAFLKPPALNIDAGANVRLMFKAKINWKRPVFYLLLPIFFVMIFLGFPLPVAPPPATKERQEESVPEVKKKKRRRDLIVLKNAGAKRRQNGDY
jgi:hypothetical protein